MSKAMFGTFPVVYPPAAKYFETEGKCALADERCDGRVEIHGYFYLDGPAILDPVTGTMVAVGSSVAELFLAEQLDYIELCAVHHGEWWADLRREYEARARGAASPAG